MTAIETLKKLGLTEYEAKIFLTLIELGASKASEINKKSGVPKNKVYELLEKLEFKGLVEIIPKTPKQYMVKNIDSLNNLLNEKEKELKSLKEQILRLREHKIEPQNNKEVVWIVNGHNPFVLKLKEAISSVNKENLSLARKVRADPILIRLTREAIERGAKVKMIFPKESDKSKIKEWKDIGVKIRYLELTPNLTFSTFDDKSCRINLNADDDISDPTLWIESKSLVNILREKFYTLWNNAKA